MLPLQYGYLLGDLVFLLFWLPLFFWRRDLRREILLMGLLIGLLSMVTSYYWWTQDWWHPLTITGTRIGIEDFLSGFFSGGIMAVIYEALFKKQPYRAKNLKPRISALTLLSLLGLTTSWLFWGIGLTSFWAATVALIGTSLLLYYLRRDLFINSVASGVLMGAISLPVYYTILLFSPQWVNATYDAIHLSGIRVTGIPIEEIIFWFLAGLVFGPFYEYWVGARLRLKKQKSPTT